MIQLIGMNIQSAVCSRQSEVRSRQSAAGSLQQEPIHNSTIPILVRHLTDSIIPQLHYSNTPSFSINSINSINLINPINPF